MWLVEQPVVEEPQRAVRNQPVSGGDLVGHHDEPDRETLGRRDRKAAGRDLPLGGGRRGGDPEGPPSLERRGEAGREPAGGAAGHHLARLEAQRARSPGGDDDEIAHDPGASLRSPDTGPIAGTTSERAVTPTIFAATQVASNDGLF